MKVIKVIEAESIISLKQEALERILSQVIRNNDDRKMSLSEVIGDEIEILKGLKAEIRERGVDGEY